MPTAGGGLFPRTAAPVGQEGSPSPGPTAPLLDFLPTAPLSSRHGPAIPAARAGFAPASLLGLVLLREFGVDRVPLGYGPHVITGRLG
jgi:hypothetical protein